MAVMNRGLVAMLGLVLFTLSAEAQERWRPLQNLRARLSGTTTPNASAYGAVTGGYLTGDTGYVPQITSLRTGGEVASYSDYPNSPYTVPEFAQGYRSRVGVLRGDGTFSWQYFDENGRFMNANWYGSSEQQAQAWAEGYNSYYRPVATPEYTASVRSSSVTYPRSSVSGGGSVRSSSSSSFARSAARLQWFQEQANAQMNAINARRSGGDSGGYSGGSGGGDRGQLFFDDSIPKR